MNIVIFTADENLYLPSFFAQLLSKTGDIKAIYYTPPGHGKNKSHLSMVKKYYKAFGLINLLNLLTRVAYTKLFDKLGMTNTLKGYSVPSVARSFNVNCEYINNVNDKHFLNKLRSMQVDLIISVSCPQIFKKDLIAIAPYGCLNIHGAPLPKYRGLLPSFWMMLNNETKAAVTIFLMNEEIDAGDVVVVEEFDIRPNESLHEFILRSKKIHCNALIKAISSMKSKKTRFKPLDTENGSYFGFPTRKAYKLFKNKGYSLW